MSHKSVREFIRDRVIAISDDIKFTYARVSDFNQIKDKNYPFALLAPLNSIVTINNEGSLIETYSVIMLFYKKDEMDSTEEQYKLILDQTDEIVQKFIRYLNNDLENDDNNGISFTSHNTLIENIRKEVGIKESHDCLTGWAVTFDLTVPDKFDYCSIYDS